MSVAEFKELIEEERTSEKSEMNCLRKQSIRFSLKKAN